MLLAMLMTTTNHLIAGNAVNSNNVALLSLPRQILVVPGGERRTADGGKQH